MRCSGCGFPLSPARTNCPRCGTTVGGKGGQSDQYNNPVEVLSASQGGPGSLGGPGNMETPQPQWGGQPSAPTWDEQGQIPFAQPANNNVFEQTPFPGMTPPPPGDPALAQNFQMWSPTSPAPVEPPRTATSATNWSHTPSPQPQSEAGAFPHPPQRTPLNPNKRTIRFGFTVSGLCILTGGLILIFVYMMSLSLPPSSSTQLSSQSNQGQNTTTPVAVKPTEAPSPTVADATSTSTAGSFPGQQYIGNAQTASAINTTAAVPTSVTSQFKTNQKIYITFTAHGGQSGTVCLLWFINNQQFDNYEFQVDANSTPAYSYTSTGTPGTGYVQVYWATQPTCADKLLAQQVNFTVSA